MNCIVSGCIRPVYCRGMCGADYEYARKHGLIVTEKERRAAFLEDVEWLLATGETHVETLTARVGAASPSAFVRRLDRHGRYDLLAKITGCYTDAVRNRVTT